MRLWIIEKTKNLLSKIEKQKKNEYIKSLQKKGKQEVKTESSGSTVPHTEQIDTTNKTDDLTEDTIPAVENEEEEYDQKVAEQTGEDQEEIKLTSEDNARI